MPEYQAGKDQNGPRISVDVHWASLRSSRRSFDSRYSCPASIVVTIPDASKHAVTLPRLVFQPTVPCQFKIENKEGCSCWREPAPNFLPAHVSHYPNGRYALEDRFLARNTRFELTST